MLEPRWKEDGPMEEVYRLRPQAGLDPPILLDLSVRESRAVVLHQGRFYPQGTLDNVWKHF